MNLTHKRSHIEAAPRFIEPAELNGDNQAALRAWGDAQQRLLHRIPLSPLRPVRTAACSKGADTC
jgi:hypothetical protein